MHLINYFVTFQSALPITYFSIRNTLEVHQNK